MTDVPMTVFDLDASGLVIDKPAPPEFIQFLFDNSRAGYLTLWSDHLSEQGGGPAIQQWINAALDVYYSRSVLTQMAPPGDKPSGAGVTEVTYSGTTNTPAPVWLAIPHVSGNGAVGEILNCTMGNWGYEPTSYSYAWRSDADTVGNDLDTYAVADTDVGKSITCVVTATNEGGSTAAPPSNAVEVAGPRAQRREYPKK